MSALYFVAFDRGKMSTMIASSARSGPEPRSWGSAACTPPATIV